MIKGTEAKGYPELLAPAGGPEALRAAVRYGADAVYMGAEMFGLRAGADNFNETEMAEGIACAHANGVKAYVTANIYARNSDIREAEAFFYRMREIKPDAFLLSDPGLFTLAKRICPDIALHISTQANNTNYETCRFWHSLGATRIVLARELTLKEIGEIREKIPDDLEIECFVHGAMCMAYSGRCLLSANLTGRDANRGDCAQPCRWEYALVEEKRPGEYMPVGEDGSGSFVMASKDLCMLEHLKALENAGINSFKIEGRMKSPLYVATVTRAYRRMMEEAPADRLTLTRYLKELYACAARPLATGFYFDTRANDALDETGGNYRNKSPLVFLGIAEAADKNGLVRITQRNKFSKGDIIEIMKPDGRNIPANVRRIVREDGTETDTAPHGGEVLYLDLDAAYETGDVLRMQRNSK